MRKALQSPSSTVFQKHGETSFRFEVLEQCQESDLLCREESWISHYGSTNPLSGYNISTSASSPMKGRKHSLATLEKFKQIARSGSSHPNSQLTEEIVVEAIELHRSGIPVKAIANKFCVHISTMALAISGKTWKHVSVDRKCGRLNNKTGCPGVYFNAESNGWVAEITIQGRYQRLGRFAEKDDAIRARKAAEQEVSLGV